MRAMKVRAVCFDYGGTLDAPGVHWLERFAALYQTAGLHRSWEQIRAAFDHATHCAYTEPGMAEIGLQPLIDFHVQRQLEHLGVNDAQLAREVTTGFVDTSRAALADSRRVLEHLRSRVRLGVISNFYGNVHHLLEEAGIGAALAVVIDSNRVGVSKPDPAIFALAVAQLGCQPRDVLYVGDSFSKDVVGARSAGLRTGWLAGATQRPCPAPELVDLHLRSLDELIGIIE